MYAVFDREVARAPPAIAFEGNGGHETHEKHLRDIKASRYGPNYACNQEATRDWESFDLRPTPQLQSTPDVQNVGGALAFSHSSDATLAYAVYTMPPFAEQPMAVVFSGSITNEEEIRAMYGLPAHPPGTQTPAELIRDLYCQDFADQYGDMSDQPATALAALEGDWSFVLYDTASSYLLVAQAANPTHPLHWGAARMDGALLFSTEPEMLPWMCSCESGRPSPFPPACYYENDGFLNPAYEHGNIFSFHRLKGHRLVKPLPKVDSRQNVCGISFRTESNKDIAAMDTPGNAIC